MDKDFNQMDQEAKGNESVTQQNKDPQTFSQEDNVNNQRNEYGFYNTQNTQNTQDYEPNQNYYNQYNNGYQNGNGYQNNDQFQNEAPQNNMNQPGGNKPPKKDNKHKVFKICGLVALGVVVGLGSIGTLRVVSRFSQNNTAITSEANKNNTSSNNNSNNSDATITEGDNSNKEEGSSSNVPIGSTDVVTESKDNGVSKVVESALPSIVMINCNVQTTQYGQSAQGVASGSGIIIKEDKDNLYIVTNYHVVSDAQKISVVFSDEASVDATLKAYDSTNDLAILKISLSKIKDATKKSIKVATLGSSDKLKVGAMAIAIGNALGYGQSVTVGYVSALDRAVTIDSATRVLLQTDAAINPGNSGGALLDINGKVIGINSAKYSSTDVEGVCYAIPISKAIPIINDLMTKETLKDEDKGYLGISGSDVDETAHAYYNVPLGVRVASVEANGAAAKGGIKEKDIITAVNGIEVTSITALKERVNGFKYGTEVTLTVQRQTDGTYKQISVKVTLQKGTAANQSSQSQNGSSSNGQSNGQSGGSQGDDDFYYYYFGGQDGSNAIPFGN
ncbi:MAG: trypsin-like peptidase domain-containing protein [bacterium]|nr:trypsin-like peptidase domain-containing protein [bacterium]